MATYSVDSDSLLAATSTIRGTIDRIQADTQSMLAQLTHLQGTWTGSAAVAFHSVVDQWRATQRQVEDSLNGINTALASAGRQYADAELATASLFR
ncbi:WXG100 family type VII secretion target [Microbacterium kunmingense]|uniref:WXG100 family type VII secretion target n=1 Tax=Microbacterium kunmingense TaxID=2915939 RepID=UPI002006ABEF|nr:WXG100 family type VII secretion target [Microbacterium kunmingense]